MKNYTFSILILLLTALGSVAYLATTQSSISVESTNNVQGQTDVPTTTQSPLYDETPTVSESDLVVQALKKACEIETHAAATFDMTGFPKVFVNDSRFPVSPKTLDFVRDVTNNPALEQAGYLDHMLAYFGWWRDGALRLEAIWEKMKAEGRDEMTADERDSLMDESGRIAPARASLEYRTHTTDCVPAILSIEFSKDIATVVVNDGPTTSEMYLVKMDDGQWYIAGRKVLQIHP